MLKGLHIWSWGNMAPNVGAVPFAECKASRADQLLLPFMLQPESPV